MSCGRYVLIDAKETQKYRDNETFEHRIINPILTALSHEGCTAKSVKEVVILNYYTHEHETAFKCDDDGCFYKKESGGI